MLKPLGLIIILLNCIGGGLYSAYKTRTELYDLKETLSFIKHIKNGIEHFNSTLDEIYSTYKTENHRFLIFLENIKSKGMLHSVIDNSTLFLNKKTREILYEMSVYLGKTQRNEQLNLLNYTIEKIKNEYDILEKKAPEKTKLSLTLYIYAGLMLIILFL